MDKTTRSIYIFHCIYLFYFWRNFLSRWKDEERRYCYRRINEKSEKSKRDDNKRDRGDSNPRLSDS